MSNQQGTRHTAHALSPLNSFEPLYINRESSPRPERPIRPVRRSSQVQAQSQLGPDAIWGHYNNYRSNGLVGSAVVHVVLLALLLAGSILGHKVVARVQQHETVTLIAPSVLARTLGVFLPSVASSSPTSGACAATYTRPTTFG